MPNSDAIKVTRSIVGPESLVRSDFKALFIGRFSSRATATISFGKLVDEARTSSEKETMPLHIFSQESSVSGREIFERIGAILSLKTDMMQVQVKQRARLTQNVMAKVT